MSCRRFHTRSERAGLGVLALVAVLVGGCGLFDPRDAPPPCNPDTDPNCKPPPEFLPPDRPEVVRDNIKAAVEGRTVQPNYERSLTPEPADQGGVFSYVPDPGADALRPGFFVGWDKEREVRFMLKLLETSGDSLRSVQLDFTRFVESDIFPESDLTRYDVEYHLTLTYAHGDPPVEGVDHYAGKANWDFAGRDRQFCTLLRWEDIGPLTVPGTTIIGTMGSLRAFVGD